MTNAVTNRRKHARVEGQGLAAYLHLDGHQSGYSVDNISVGGVFVRTDRFVAVGTKLTFDLLKPGMAHSLPVAGSVVGVVTQEMAPRVKQPQGLRIQFQPM